jgi:hypothetical protein
MASIESGLGEPDEKKVDGPTPEGSEKSGSEKQIEAQQEQLNAAVVELQGNVNEFEKLSAKEPEKGWSSKVKKEINGVRDFIAENKNRILLMSAATSIVGGLIIGGAQQVGRVLDTRIVKELGAEDMDALELAVKVVGVTAATILVEGGLLHIFFRNKKKGKETAVPS